MADREQIKSLRASGHTHKQIANITGLSVGAIRYNLIDHRRNNNIWRISDHRRKLKRKAVEYSGGECLRCTYNISEASLDFHHTDPTQKDFQISRGSTISWQNILPEVNKTIMLCKNCHTELHYGVWELPFSLIDKQMLIRTKYIDKPLVNYKSELPK